MISDSVISVYNDEGIKTIGIFDINKQLCFEVAIPLKHLGVKLKEAAGITYSIKLNGLSPKNTVYYPPGSDVVKVVTFPNGLVPRGSSGLDAIISTTDFWGEYPLHQ